MDSTAHTALKGLSNDQRTAVTGDAWIRQARQPLGTEKLLSRVTRGFDSSDSPIGSQKLLSRVTGGFDSPDSPLGSQKLVSR
jgi:hypothetical protein